MVRRLPVLLLVALAAVMSLAQVAANPQLAVTAPTDGETISGTTVTVRFEVTDFTIVASDVPLEEAGRRPEANRPGEGHVHLMLDTFPVVVWTQDAPYTFTDVPPGEHLLTVELAENDHAPLSPPVVQQVRFRTVADQVMPVTGGPWLQPSGVVAVTLLAGLALVAGGLLLRRIARHPVSS
jgi:hypothetical protein